MGDQNLIAHKIFRNQLYKLPTDVIVLIRSRARDYVAEEDIVQMALDCRHIIHTKRVYNHQESHFGLLPNLILKTQVFTRYELLEPLCDIEYEKSLVEDHYKAKTLILNFSKAMNKVLVYYKHHTDFITNNNHLSQKDIKKELIEQFTMISLILEEMKGRFDVANTGKKVPLTDIVIYCFIHSIIRNIPNSYPEYLLRTTYSGIFQWYLLHENIKAQVQDEKEIAQKIFGEHAKEDTYVNGLESHINVNGKKFALSLGVAALVYGLFT